MKHLVTQMIFIGILFSCQKSLTVEKTITSFETSTEVSMDVNQYRSSTNVMIVQMSGQVSENIFLTRINGGINDTITVHPSNLPFEKRFDYYGSVGKQGVIVESHGSAKGELTISILIP
jgi:hypothetical protein